MMAEFKDCECPEPGCQHDEDKFEAAKRSWQHPALLRIATAIVNAHDYGSGATDICRAVADNIEELRSIAYGK